MKKLIVLCLVCLLLIGCSSNTVSGIVTGMEEFGGEYSLVLDTESGLEKVYVSMDTYYSVSVGDSVSLSCVEKAFVTECE
jgi:uncharacterized protein YcfL